MTEENLRTKAGIITGFVAGKADVQIPGVLELAAGQLSFTVHKGSGLLFSDAEDGACLFSVPLSELGAIKFPWYYLGLAFKFKTGGTNYLVDLTEGSFFAWPKAIREGKSWKVALAAPTAFPKP